MKSMKFNPQSKDPLELRRSWELFMEKDIISSNIPPIIAQSWKSHKQKNTNPFRPKVEIDLHTYDQYMNSNEFFIEYATDFVKSINSYLDRTSIQLFNADALLLKIYGDQRIIERLSEINNAPGGIHNEQTGTNGVNLSIQTKKTAFVAGAEHFCSMFHDVSCIAMPIFNRNTNEVQWSIDITGPFEMVTPQSFALLDSMREAIQNKLDHFHLQQNYTLLDHFQNRFLHGSEAALIINTDKVVVHCSEKAAHLLGYSGKKENRISTSALGIDNLDFYLNMTEDEADFYSTLRNDYEVRIIINRIFHNSVFQGWMMRLLPTPLKAAQDPKIQRTTTFDELIGRSKSFQSAVDTAKRVASSDATLLILGETGTGKEMFAKAIHEASNRSNMPFVSVNCGAIPKELIGSELFGYEAGAFSGAKKGGQKGKFELADGGTIFLDEVGELSLEHQVYLLRVLQEKEICRLGAQKPIPINVRVIAATNVDLKEAIKNKTFREDLYFRLNILSLNLPSLRERGKDDVIRLVRYFAVTYNRKEGKNVTFTKEALNLMASYPWKGNVRELENSVYRLVVLANQGNITPEDVRLILGDQVKEKEEEREIAVTGPAAPLSISEMERNAILQALRHHHGHLSNVAKALNISRATLYRKIDKYQINVNKVIN
ncbi:sigma-54-dependent Fis family transcriptional regulator [Bacillus dakarensis]|uniref:sigma-54-dependent Fis family transcriptional regulator n=1 Tax=Robertmurraya dakarensis TaxID=1926278 RepID=UPI000980EF08|nr:sigma 54-interacting transcriptional regulator [Bacillus dakarensis]